MTPRLRRILTITAALAAVGAVVGGVLGGLLVGLIEAFPRPWRWTPTALLIGAAFGGAVGFVLAPVAAWALMRRVPIWRAIVDTAIGTTIGVGLGMVFEPTFRVVALSPLVLGVVGFAAAALRLRLFYRGDAAAKPAERIG